MHSPNCMKNKGSQHNKLNPYTNRTAAVATATKPEWWQQTVAWTYRLPNALPALSRLGRNKYEFRAVIKFHSMHNNYNDDTHSMQLYRMPFKMMQMILLDILLNCLKSQINYSLGTWFEQIQICASCDRMPIKTNLTAHSIYKIIPQVKRIFLCNGLELEYSLVRKLSHSENVNETQYSASHRFNIIVSIPIHCAVPSIHPSIHT